jgi:hypothetical protein
MMLPLSSSRLFPKQQSGRKRSCLSISQPLTEVLPGLSYGCFHTFEFSKQCLGSAFANSLDPGELGLNGAFFSPLPVMRDTETVSLISDLLDDTEGFGFLSM